VLAIAGWKDSGKTTLTTRLVSELVERGWRVSTVKHAHHDAEIDRPGTDSFRHREAGAHEVALVTANRWALMHELRGEAEPSLMEIVARLERADIVIAEGFKRAPVRKLEVAAPGTMASALLYPTDQQVVAVAADHDLPPGHPPQFARDDIAGLADFVERHFAMGHSIT
jgi:molybdopterin-guanine dinucleotide biosynthesis protein B